MIQSVAISIKHPDSDCIPEEIEKDELGVKCGDCGMKTKTPLPETASELYRPPLVGEVSANFLRIEGATWSA
jgi:hypothetical protein